MEEKKGGWVDRKRQVKEGKGGWEGGRGKRGGKKRGEARAKK